MQNMKETYLNLMGQQVDPLNVAALSDGIYFKMSGGEKMRMFLKGGQWINPLAQAQEGSETEEVEETIYDDHDKAYDYKVINGQWQTRRKGSEGDWIDLSTNEAATTKLNTAYPDAMTVVDDANANTNTTDVIDQDDLNSIVDDSGGQDQGLQLNKDNLKFISPQEGNLLSPMGDTNFIDLIKAVDTSVKSFKKENYYDPGSKMDYTKFSHTNTTDEDLYIDQEALAKGKRTGKVLKDAEQMTEIEMQKYFDERHKNNPQMFDKVKNFDADLYEQTGHVDRRRGLFNRKVKEGDFKEGDYLENKYGDASHIGFSVDKMGKYTKGFDYLTANEDGETFDQQSFDGFQNPNSGGDDSREYERSDKHNDDYNFANETSFESYKNAGINHNMNLEDDDPFGYTKIPTVGPLTPIQPQLINTNTPEPELQLADPTELYLDNIEEELRRSQGPLDQTDPQAVINANDQISLDEANQRYVDNLDGLVPRATPVGPREDGRGLRYGGDLPKAQEGTGFLDFLTNPIRKRLAENLYPVNYSGPAPHLTDPDFWEGNQSPEQKVLEALKGNKENYLLQQNQDRRKYADQTMYDHALIERTDLLHLLMGQDQKHNSMNVSEYRPTKAKDKNITYYKSKVTEDYLRDLLNNVGYDNIHAKGDKDYGERYNNQNTSSSLATFQIDKGEDKKGKYISYYDIWDLDPFKKETFMSKVADKGQSLLGVTPPEIYGRIYIDDDKSVEPQSKVTIGGIKLKEKKHGGSLPKAQKGLNEFCTNAPIINSGGKVFAQCRNRDFDSKHDAELGATMSLGKLNNDFTSSFGLSGGYTFNPSGGTGGLKTYIGGNYGLRGTEDSSVDDGLNGTTVDMDNYMKALISAGYTGEVGGNSYNWQTPLQYELGAYADKDLMGNNGTTFGGYGRVGPVNIKGGYNPNTGSEFSMGLGLPIRKGGGSLKKMQFAGSPDATGYNPLTNQFTPMEFNTGLQASPLSMNMFEGQSVPQEKTEPFFNTQDRMYAMNQSVNRSMDSWDAFTGDMNKRMENPTLQMNQVDSNPLNLPEFKIDPEISNQIQMDQDKMAFKTAREDDRVIGNTIIPTEKESRKARKEFGKKLDETIDGMPKYQGTKENLKRFDRSNELGFDGDLVAMDEYDQNETEEGTKRGLREDQLNKDNKDANPSFGDKLWNLKNRALDSKVGQTYQKFGAAAVNIAKPLNRILEQREEREAYKNQMNNAYLSDNIFASVDADLSGSKGDYDVNSGIFRAEDKITTRQGKYGTEISNYLTFAKNGGSFFNDGGEAEIDINMYKELIAAGADIEII